MLRASVWGVVKRSGVVGLSSGSLSLSVPFRRLVASGGVNRRWVATVPKKVQMEPSAAAPVTPKDTELILQQNSLLSKEQRRELVLSPPALVVTREYEWGNILIGFEQVRTLLRMKRSWKEKDRKKNNVLQSNQSVAFLLARSYVSLPFAVPIFS